MGNKLPFCPLCGSSMSYRARLLHKNNYSCSNSGLKLEIFNESKYKLIDLKDKDHYLWKNYANKIFSLGDWFDIMEKSEDAQSKIDEERKNLEKIRHAVTVFIANNLKNGNFSDLPYIQSPIDIGAEKCIILLDNIRLHEPQSISHTTTHTNGTSYEGPFGNTNYYGTSYSDHVSYEELKPIDVGQLLLTDKRLYYLGSNRTLIIDYDKIISIEEFKDGIKLRRRNKQKVECFIGTDETSLRSYEVAGLIEILFYGILVKNIILSQK